MTARKIALLIGNDSYRDPRLAPLVVPGEDVRGLESVLADQAIGAFDEVRPLLNADRTGVVEEIERLFAEAQRDDLVLLYFSGHGLLDRDGRLYLALSATKIDRPVASALRSDDLRDLMEQGRCQRQVLILDCCYSGAFARPAKDAGDAPAVTPATFASQGEGRVALLSSTATQRSLEGSQVQGEIERSLFTHFLVEGLKTGAAAAGAELITEEVLFQYAYDRVRAAGADMTPQRWVGRQHGRLVIARNPVWRPDPRTLLPARLLAALDDSEPFVREGAVRELGRQLAEPSRREVVRAVLEVRLGVERDRFVYEEIRAALGRVSPAGADPTPPGNELGSGQAGQRRSVSQLTRFKQAVFRLQTYAADQQIAPPECFISYAWGEQAHERWVEKRLASDLQNAGIRVLLDRWEIAQIGASVARFAERIEECNHIVVVGTPLYLQKAKSAVSATGSVVPAEWDLIGIRMLAAENQKRTVLPVLLAGNESESFPPLLRGRVYGDFRADEDYFITAFDLILALYQLPPNHPAVVDLRESLREWKLR